MDQAGKAERAEAKECHVKKVNSKVSIVYDTSAASRSAHAKLLAEQKRDPKCKKIVASLTTGSGEGVRELSNISSNTMVY